MVEYLPSKHEALSLISNTAHSTKNFPIFSFQVFIFLKGSSIQLTLLLKTVKLVTLPGVVA
jgi:hypothetical protein